MNVKERKKKDFVEMARNTRPFVSKEVWDVLEKYMDFMKNLPDEEGMNYKKVYENLDASSLIKRLIFKRPVVFYKKNDSCMLRWNGNKIIEGSNLHLDVAKKFDGSSPCLSEYISYDENLLSSLICMSTPTFYVSDGSLKNKSEKSIKPHIENGILCGLVGARNSKEGFMENRFIFPKNANFSEKVHKSDKFWLEFYSEAFPEGEIPTIERIQNNPQIYCDIYKDGVNVIYFQKRLMLSIIPFIEEAIARGFEMKKEIFCSVPAIGGGVWRGKIKANLVIELIILGVLKFLDQNFNPQHFHPLKALCLPKTNLKIYSTFKPKNKIKNLIINENGTVLVIFKDSIDHKIVVFNESRYVAAPLPVGFENCVSVAAFAWDGNSYAGNEYWCGKLSSFDSQAIYCSLLGQFQNPEVNTKLADKERIKIYG